MLTNEGDIAECMSEYFASVFTAENFDSFPSFDQVIKDKDLCFIHCSPKDVSKILSELKPRKCPGPDSIQPMMELWLHYLVMFLMLLLYPACYHTTGNWLTLLLFIRKVLKTIERTIAKSN